MRSVALSQERPKASDLFISGSY